jgi:hypothetical protein
MDKPFQRKNSTSNAAVGKDFEKKAKNYFKQIGMELQTPYNVSIGHYHRHDKAFDLGGTVGEIEYIVECKSHRWTESGKSPSAKLTVWNEAMYCFSLIPSRENLKKILFVVKSTFTSKPSLAEYYCSRYRYMIPEDVEIWEYDQESKEVVIIHKIQNQKAA